MARGPKLTTGADKNTHAGSVLSSFTQSRTRWFEDKYYRTLKAGIHNTIVTKQSSRQLENISPYVRSKNVVSVPTATLTMRRCLCCQRRKSGACSKSACWIISPQNIKDGNLNSRQRKTEHGTLCKVKRSMLETIVKPGQYF